MNKKTIRDINVSGKTVLVRCDFNVPLNENKEITDDRRIISAMETIKYLNENGAKVVLTSHLGRPKGKFNPDFSLKPVAKRIKEIVNVNVLFLEDERVISDKVIEEIKNAEQDNIILLENVRFREEETKNEKMFSKELASVADIYVNDAFGTSHRAHSSTTGVAEFLPSAIGFLIEKELKFISESIKSPKKPFIAILGGAKVSDKIGVINNLIDVVDELIIGGGMAYTFIKAMGHNIGNSLLEEDKLELAKELLKKAKEKGVDIVLPLDTVVAKEFKDTDENWVVDIKEIPDGSLGLDIGPKTIEDYRNRILRAETIIWNGPMGVFEMKAFEKGTKEVALALSSSKAVTIIGGGDSAAAIDKFKLSENISHISTGGGASLELMEGKVLPGIDIIDIK